MTEVFQVKLWENDDQWMPERAHDTDAGFDLKARLFGSDDSVVRKTKEKLKQPEQFTLRPGGTILVRTGVWIQLKSGWEAQVRPRSGNALKKDLTVLNAPGTIDSDYRGEVGVILHNCGALSRTVCQGDKVAQLVIKRVPEVALVKTSSLDETERGSGGFGSTGD